MGKYSINRFRSSGFTLIEVMITVVIIAVLTAISWPIYQKYVLRANRTDAMQILMQNAQWMERNHSINFKYPTGGLPLPGFIEQSPERGDVKYDIAIKSVTDTAYELEATPKGPQLQDECGSFTLDQSGKKMVQGETDPASQKVQTCWRGG